MKMKVTRRGVYDAKGEEIKVGTVLEIDGDKVPGYLLNKAVETDDAVGIINPAAAGTEASAAERQARLKEIVGGLSEGDFIASGAPDVGKVNELLNAGEKPFTAAERDQLWPGIKPAA